MKARCGSMRLVSALTAVALLLMVCNTHAYGSNRLRTLMRTGGNYISTFRDNLSRHLLFGLAAATIVCATSSCTTDKVADTVRDAKNRVIELGHDRGASLDEIIGQMEEARVGVVRSVDQQGTLAVEVEGSTVYLQLADGDVLINNGESSLKVALSGEEIGEGWIASGSVVAIIPASVVAGLLLFYTGLYAVPAVIDVFDMYRNRELYLKSYLVNGTVEFAIVTGIGGFASLTMGLGTYHLLVLL